MDTVEAAVDDHAGNALSERPRGGLLESAGVELRDAARHTETRKVSAQDTNPIARIDVGIRAIVKRGTYGASLGPLLRDLAQLREVVLAFDLSQFGKET